MKKVISVLITLCLIFSTIPMILVSAAIGSWEYSASAEFITIEKYNGSDKNVTVPERIEGNEVVAIAESAFAGNTRITSVTIPDSVSYIYDNAFYGCENLATIKAHDYMYVGKQVFEGTAFYNDETNWKDGILYFYDSVLKAKTDIKTVNFIEDVHTICPEAFKDCVNLATVTIPAAIYMVDKNAFDGCNNLKEVILERKPASDSQINIADYAFLNCESLKSVKIPENVANISLYAFGYAYNESTNLEYVKNNDFVVYGVKGTSAEIYAKSNSYEFVEYDFENGIIKCDHEKIATIDKVFATYFKKGYSGDGVCLYCNQLVKKGVEVAKLTLKTPKFKLTKGKKLFKVKYTKVADAVGFQVRYKLKGNWKVKNFDTKKSATKIIKSLKKGTYQVQIRAFVKQGKQKAYSNWTTAKKVKVK